jgi:hypothetical protein
MDPPSRNAMWRFGFPNPVDTKDNELWCGGQKGIILFGIVSLPMSMNKLLNFSIKKYRITLQGFGMLMGGNAVFAETHGMRLNLALMKLVDTMRMVCLDDAIPRDRSSILKSN